MDIISEKARNYLPYDLETRLHLVRRAVESGWSIRNALSYYKVKRISFWRWRKRYDGAVAAKGKGFSAVRRDDPNLLERFCLENGIVHKFIRPRLLKCFTPIEN